MRIAGAITGMALLFILAGAIYSASLFEEPSATDVPSLVEHVGAQSLLAVFAHPDDEVLVASLLSDAARRSDVVVRLITVTRGEVGYFDPPVSRREDLALVRTAEVLKHGFALGLDEQEIWDYPDRDSGDESFSSDEIEAIRGALVQRIRKWKPDLVATFEPGTGYTLNGQHRLVGRTVTEAVRAAAGSGAEGPDEAHRVATLAYVLAPRRAWRMAGPWAHQVADLQPEPDLAIPADRGVKVRGWEIHESQRGVARRSMGPSLRLFYFFYDKEHYALKSASEEELSQPAAPGGH